MSLENMGTAGAYNPQTNDVLLRHLIMQYYTDTVETGSNLKMWINSPKVTRHGIIDRKGIPYRVAFMRLFSMTKYIRGVTDSPMVQEIEQWINRQYDDRMNEEQKVAYFTKGLNLSDQWAKVLFEQSIINFS